MTAKMHGSKQYPLAGLETGDVLANLDDFTGYVAAQNVRKRDFRSSFADPQIKMIHGASAYSHQHLVLPQLRLGDVLVPQNLGPASFVNANSFHQSFLRTE
jgi:hypothetical protein